MRFVVAENKSFSPLTVGKEKGIKTKKKIFVKKLIKKNITQ